MLGLYVFAAVCSLVAVGMHIIGVLGVGGHPPFYHRIWWWDWLAHAVVSVPIATTFLSFATLLTSSLSAIIVITMSLTMLVGGYWELLEAVATDEMDSGSYLYPEDTGFDLVTEYAVTTTILIYYIVTHT